MISTRPFLYTPTHEYLHCSKDVVSKEPNFALPDAADREFVDGRPAGYTGCRRGLTSWPPGGIAAATLHATDCTNITQRAVQGVRGTGRPSKRLEGHRRRRQAPSHSALPSRQQFASATHSRATHVVPRSMPMMVPSFSSFLSASAAVHKPVQASRNSSATARAGARHHVTRQRIAYILI
jgi:hypothetical protein